MIFILGHYSLILSFSIIIILTFLLICSLNSLIKINKKYFIKLISLYYIFINLAFFTLIYLYIISDFRLIIILENSNIKQALIYKICSLWSNIEGSFILWLWCITNYLYLYILLNKYLPYFILLRLLIYLNIFLIFYLYIIIIEVNPFTKLFVLTLIDHQFDLNPQLQDYKLLIHPPLVYLGYSGSLISFLFILLIINNNNIYLYIEKFINLWVYLCWVFLSLGIITGSHWAYYELGWGGWWFWDPVENVSLIPWVLNTIALHLCIKTRKKNLFKNFLIILLILNYISCLFSNFLIKSGNLQTVHNFIQINLNNKFVVNLLFISFILLFYFFIKNKKYNHSLYISILSTSDLIKILNLIIFTFSLILFYITCYPLLSKYFFNTNTYIREEIINEILISLFLPLLLFYFIKILFNIKNNLKKFNYLIIVLISYSLSFFLYSIIYKFKFYFLHNLNNVVLLVLTLILIITLLYLYYKAWVIKKIVILTHISFLLFIVALLLSYLTQIEIIKFIDLGDMVKCFNSYYILLNIYEIECPNTYITSYKINIIKNNLHLSTFFLEKKYFFIQNQVINKNIIETTLLNDINIFLLKGFLSEKFALKIEYNFFINIIWFNWYLMVVSIILILIKNFTNLFTIRKFNWI